MLIRIFVYKLQLAMVECYIKEIFHEFFTEVRCSWCDNGVETNSCICIISNVEEKPVVTCCVG